MAGMEWLLETALIGLLAATLFHALRLERALGVLKRDRAVLEELVAGFNASTRQAEAGIDRLRGAAEGVGRQIARQIDGATALKDDLLFLIERGERLADRIDTLVRSGRPLAAEPPMRITAEPPMRIAAEPPMRMAELPVRTTAEPAVRLVAPEPGAEQRHRGAPEPAEPRVRSQAERDLIKALRLAR